MKAHGNMCTQPNPRISWSREQVQAKKGPCGLTKSAKMEQSSSPKKGPSKELKVGKPAFVHPNQKEQLETHTRELSLWEWTKDCPFSFLPLFAWRE